jgi:GNAT superfamily N-acetyltransferase
MVTYQVEPWDQFQHQAAPLWERHWEEIALDKAAIKLNVDFRAYDQMDAMGMLHVVVARDAGAIVGYHLSFVRPHFHYANSLTAYTDVYWVAPECRKGRVGIALFQFVEKTLKARGVERMFSACKLHKDVGKLFERLGWTETERVFSKRIGG